MPGCHPMALDQLAALPSFIIRVTEILLSLKYNNLKAMIFVQLTKHKPPSIVLFSPKSRIGLLTKLPCFGSIL